MHKARVPNMTACTSSLVSGEIFLTATAVKSTEAFSVPKLKTSSIIRRITVTAIDDTLCVRRWATGVRRLVLPSGEAKDTTRGVI